MRYCALLLSAMLAIGLLVAILLVAFGARLAGAAEPPLAVCIALDASASNHQPSDGYAASDPGPVFRRVEVVRLLTDLLGTDTGGRRVLLGFAPFGTDVVARWPLTDIRDNNARAALIAQLEQSLRPSGWTSVDRGLAACAELLLDAADQSRRRIVVLSDGRPERPEAGANVQVRHITEEILPGLVSRGVIVDTVLYGDAAANPADPAAAVMRTIAEVGGGRTALAPRGLDLLGVTVALATEMSGEQLRLSESRRAVLPGAATIEIELPPDLSSATIIAVRSRLDITLAVSGPDGTKLASTAAGQGDAPSYSLLHTLSAPRAGAYTVLANGPEGDVRVWVVTRARPIVIAATGTPTSSATATRPTVTSPVPELRDEAAPEAGSTERDGAGRPWLPLLLVVLLLAGVGGASWLVWARRRRTLPGVLVLWAAGQHSTVTLAEVPALARPGDSLPLADLLEDDQTFGAGACRLERDANRVLLHRGVDAAEEPVVLIADMPVVVDEQHGVSVTWHPTGVDEVSLEVDRPADAGQAGHRRPDRPIRPGQRRQPEPNPSGQGAAPFPPTDGLGASD